MADVHSPQTRSYNMSRIKSKNTRPEMLVRKFLFANGFRYRLHSSKLPGKPDIILPKYKTVIFVHGCFWHGHDCIGHKIPKTNKKFWTDKISNNMNRDKQQVKQLKKLGWQVIEIWQCNLKPSVIEKNLYKVLNKLRNI